MGADANGPRGFKRLGREGGVAREMFSLDMTARVGSYWPS